MAWTLETRFTPLVGLVRAKNRLVRYLPAIRALGRKLLHDVGKGLPGCFSPQHEPDQLRSTVALKELRHSTDSDVGGFAQRVAVGARTERGKGDAFTVVFDGQFQAASVGAGQQFGLSMLSTVPDRSHRVEDVFGGQLPGGGHYGRTGGTASGVQAICRLHDAGAPAAMNRSVHPAAAGEPSVGGIHDGVHSLVRDITRYQLELRGIDRDEHGFFPPFVLSCRGQVIRHGFESYLFSLFFVFSRKLLLDVSTLFRQNPPRRGGFSLPGGFRWQRTDPHAVKGELVSCDFDRSSYWL